MAKKFNAPTIGKVAVQSSGFEGKVVRKVFKGRIKQNKPVEKT